MAHFHEQQASFRIIRPQVNVFLTDKLSQGRISCSKT